MRKYSILLFLLLSLPLCVGQNVRYSTSFPSISSTTATPYLVANVPPNSPVVAVCSSPANQTPCTNYATTYDSTGAACPNGAQDTPDPQPSACQSTGDAQGNVAFWAPPGTYDYTVTVDNQTFGPYTITLGGTTNQTTECGGMAQAHQPNTNFVAGTNFSLSCANNPGNSSTDVTFGFNLNPLVGNPAATQTVIQPNPSGAAQTSLNENVIGNVVTITPDLAAFVAPVSPATISIGAVTLTFATCPLGVSGLDLVASGFPHWWRIKSAGGDTSPDEYALITGGTCRSGLSTGGTITLNAAFSHIAGYTVGSASDGIAEGCRMLANPNVKCQLMAHSTYVIHAPTWLPTEEMVFDGQGSTIIADSFSSSLVGGTSHGTTNWGVAGAASTVEVKNILFKNGARTCWKTALTGAITGGSPTATLSLSTGPTGFYAAQPQQLLWVNGDSAGLPLTELGPGEYVTTTGNGTCVPGLAACTVEVTEAIPGTTNLSAHDSGSQLMNCVAPMIEAAEIENGHYHDLRFATNSTTDHGLAGSLVMVDGDQNFHMESAAMDCGSCTRKGDPDYQSSGVLSLGNSAIIYLGEGVDITKKDYCVYDLSGNDFSWVAGICQDSAMAGVLVGNRRGGFGRFYIGGMVHFEQGSLINPFGNSNPIGIPFLMVFGSSFPTHVDSPYIWPGGIIEHGAYPIWLVQGGQSATWYIYAVAHNNLAAGCTSGGDCFSAPVLLGMCEATDLSATPCTMSFYGWGAGAGVNVVTAYDILGVPSASGTVTTPYPPAPSGAGNYGLATGLSPATICAINNLCTVVLNVAPGSLTSYTPVTLLTSTKRFYPSTPHLPGPVGLSTQLSGANLTVVATYQGMETCVNSFEFLGSRWPAVMTAAPVSTGPLPCPGSTFPYSVKGQLAEGIGAGGACGAFAKCLVSIAASATTVTISSTAIQPWSDFTVTEDPTKGTLLGVTCNTTPGRTYSFGSTTFGKQTTLTASAAPVTNPACLIVNFNNGPQ